MDVESLAVSNISSRVARCDRLRPFISVNDKTPFTDGHIDVHRSSNTSNANWEGRVPVQIKGRQRATRSPLQKFPIARTDLLAFQKDSGVLYFVVTVNKKTRVEKVYFALLSPFAIDGILRDGPPGATSAAVAMTPLADDLSALERLVRLALRTRDQNVSLGFDETLMEQVESLSLHTANELDFSVPVTLAQGSNDFALVLHTTGGLSMPVPGNFQVLPHEYMERRVEVEVRSGQHVFKEVLARRLDREKVLVTLCDGLEVTFVGEAETKARALINLRLSSNFAQRKRAIQFFLSLRESGQFEVEGVPQPVAVDSADDGQEADELRAHLHELALVDDLFQALDVNSSLINLDEVTEDQWRSLSVFRRAFVDGDEIDDRKSQTSRVIFSFGKWHFFFLITPGGSAASRQLLDPFSDLVQQQYLLTLGEGAEREVMPGTAYDMLEDEYLGTTLNLRLGSMVAAYEPLSDHQSTYALANKKVLGLIAAADRVDVRAGELLKAAEGLNDWLMDEQGPEPQNQVNRWQIQARQRSFTDAQLDEIRKFKRSVVDRVPDQRTEYELACAILLQEEREVAFLIAQLDEDRLNLFKEWPIWNVRRTDRLVASDST